MGQPRLRRPQVPATQQTAAVTAIPLPCPHKKPGVLLDPVQVRVQGVDQVCHAGLEPGVLVKEDPIPLPDGLRNWLAVAGPAAQQGDDLLARLDRLCKFRPTRAGGQRVRGDHEDELCAPGDRCGNLRLVGSAERHHCVILVPRWLSPRRSKSVVQTPREMKILSRIRYENLCHTALPTCYGESVLRQGMAQWIWSLAAIPARRPWQNQQAVIRKAPGANVRCRCPASMLSRRRAHCQPRPARRPGERRRSAGRPPARSAGPARSGWPGLRNAARSAARCRRSP